MVSSRHLNLLYLFDYNITVRYKEKFAKLGDAERVVPGADFIQWHGRTTKHTEKPKTSVPM